METNLYTYAYSWQNPIYSKTLWATIRSSYFYRSVPLLLTMPFDLIVLGFILISRKKFNILFATEKWPKLTEIAAERTSTACISPIKFIINHPKSKSVYFPASFFYLLAAMGIVLPHQLRRHWTVIAVYIVSLVLKRMTNRSATLVVHSDALPFGRVLVMAANKSSIRTVCIQHGNFQECNVIKEQDGFLCDHNIVRSSEDGEIIKRRSKKTLIHVLPNFFVLNITRRSPVNPTPRVLLLGEGYHIIDKEFNSKYLNILKSIEQELVDSNFSVVFRPHPSERKMAWGSTFKEVDLSPIETSLTLVDAVVGYSSTLLQESAEVGIPAFYLDPLQQGHKIKGRNGVAIHKFKNSSQVMGVINNNLYNNSKKQNIKIDDGCKNILNILIHESF